MGFGANLGPILIVGKPRDDFLMSFGKLISGFLATLRQSLAFSRAPAGLPEDPEQP